LQHFGFPYCHQGDFADPEFGWGKSCAEYVKPAVLLDPHAAPLGMRFYTGKFTNDDLRAFAAYISRLPPPAPPPDAPDAARFARGQAVTRQHPCGVCHNPDFSGREQMPRLANQREDYLLKAMREYKSGSRIGYAGAMATELQRLSDDDLQDVAHFFAHLPRAPGRATP
jgi:cytochrome c553